VLYLSVRNKTQVFRNMGLSVNTVGEGVNDVAEDMRDQLK